MKHHVVTLLAKEEGRWLVREYCGREGLDITLIDDLVDAELEQVGKQRKAGLWEKFDELLGDLGDEKNVSPQDRP